MSCIPVTQLHCSRVYAYACARINDDNHGLRHKTDTSAPYGKGGKLNAYVRFIHAWYAAWCVLPVFCKMVAIDWIDGWAFTPPPACCCYCCFCVCLCRMHSTDTHTHNPTFIRMLLSLYAFAYPLTSKYYVQFHSYTLICIILYYCGVDWCVAERIYSLSHWSGVARSNWGR